MERAKKFYHIGCHLDFPVTQVSYNDALAYANWCGGRLPSYEEYWRLVDDSQGLINQNTSAILPQHQCNIIGNTWEITSPDSFGRIRFAGGSYLCSPKTCNGVSQGRKLYVDKETGNSNIGFAIIR